MRRNPRRVLGRESKFLNHVNHCYEEGISFYFSFEIKQLHVSLVSVESHY